MELRFEFDGWPPSVNSIYATDWRTKKRFPSGEYKLFKKKIAELLKNQLPPVGIFCLEIHLKGSFHTKKGKVKKLDLSNRIKALEDAMCEALEYDDSLHFQIKCFKVPATADSTLVCLFPLDEH